MSDIGRELKAMLYDEGASLVGFADMGQAAKDGLPYGVSVAVAIPAEVVRSIHDGPTGPI
jgi:hypothetical protein